MKLFTSILATSLFVSITAVNAEEHECLIEPYQIVAVGSAVIGIIDSVSVDRGDTVSKGQLVAQLDHKLEDVALTLSETHLSYLRKQFERFSTLQLKSLASDEQYDQTKNELELAELEVVRRRLLSNQKAIISPITGVVVERLLSVGEYVYEQAPIMKIAQVDPLNVEVLLPVSFYNAIKKALPQ